MKITKKRFFFKLQRWVNLLITSSKASLKPKLNEVIIGYDEDTIPTLILYLSAKELSLNPQAADADDQTASDTMDFQSVDQTFLPDKDEELIDQIKKMLLRCATADCVLRLSSSSIASNALQEDDLWSEYFNNQKHTSLRDLIAHHIETAREESMSAASHDRGNATVKSINRNLIQITTNSMNCLSKTGWF